MIELEAKHYDVIMDCLEDFDFEKVSNVMTFLNWEWSIDEHNYRVPTVKELRNQAREHLKEVIKGAIERKNVGDEYITATGGFRYEAKLYPDDFVWVRMSFTIEDWDNCE